MKLIKLLIICSLILLTVVSCGAEPWGPLVESKINTRNPKYTVEIKTWGPAMAFDESTSRLYVYKAGSKRKVAELRGTSRFMEVYWKDKDNLVVIDFEVSPLQKHGIHKLKYGKLTITNICYICTGGGLRNITSDSLSYENGVLTFYNTELDRNLQRIISVPIDQYIFTNKVKDNIIEFETIPVKPTEPISNYKVKSNLYRVKLSDSNISKLNYFISQKME